MESVFAALFALIELILCVERPAIHQNWCIHIFCQYKLSNFLFIRFRNWVYPQPCSLWTGLWQHQGGSSAGRQFWKEFPSDELLFLSQYLLWIITLMLFVIWSLCHGKIRVMVTLIKRKVCILINVHRICLGDVQRRNACLHVWPAQDIINHLWIEWSSIQHDEYCRSTVLFHYFHFKMYLCDQCKMGFREGGSVMSLLNIKLNFPNKFMDAILIHK